MKIVANLQLIFFTQFSLSFLLIFLDWSQSEQEEELFQPETDLITVNSSH